MATEKSFALIGEFRDNITAKLRKLNREINTINKSFQKMQSKLRPIARDMGTIAMASERVTKALKDQRTGYQSNINSMRSYRTEMGKTVAAAKKLSQIKPPKPMPMPRGGGGRVPAAVPSRGGGGGGAAAAVSGGILGMQVGNLMTNAVVKGFQIGTSLMTKPFRFLQSGIAERIADEMSDVRAAGGLFAISSRMDDPFVKSFREAEELTKETNRYLAQLAGALPGDTQEYINISKQISDGIYTIISNDKENAVSFAKELAAGRGADLTRFEQGGTKALQAAGQELVGEMTKLTVLAGLGGQQGAFGLPQLVEQMMSKEQVSVQSFARYSAIFRDPMIKGALERNVDAINKAGANTTDRLKALRATLEEVVTPDLVRRYQRTTSGVIEAFKTTFLNPEVGLLGLGRPLQMTTVKFDEFGRMLDKNNKVTTKLSEAARENLSVFDYLRDIFANLMIVLQPVLDVGAQLFDPFTELGKQLEKIRMATMYFQGRFESFTQWFKDQGKMFDAGTIPLRGAMSAIVDALARMGALTQAEVDKFVAVIKDPKAGMAQFGQMIKDMINKFLNSDAAKQVGEAIGAIIGSVLSVVGDLMAQVTGLAKAGPLAEGFSSGFKGAGGPQAISNIIRGVFELLGKALIEVVKAAPMETAMVAGLALLPSIIASAVGGMATAIVGKVASIFSKGTKLPDLKNLGGAASAAGKQTTGAMQALPGVAKASKAAKALTTAGKMKGVGLLAAGAVTMATHAPKLAKVGKALTNIGKRVPGLNVAFAGLDFALQKMSGESTKKAAASAGGGLVGSVIGGAIGTAIAPGIGTAVGSVLGGFIGDWIGQKLPAMLAGIGPLISKAWSGFTQFISNLPGNLMWVIGYAIGSIEKGWSNLTQFVLSLPEKISSAIASLMGWFQSLPGKFKVMADNFIKNVPNVVNTVKDGLGKVTDAIINWVKGIPGRIGNFFMGLGGKFQEGREAALGPNGGSGTRFKSVAEGYGLQMTSFMRPGDQGSYHSIGRAMDFSNSTGPTTEMMAFAEHMVNSYGSTLKELIYTPLGFSIKNGRMVAPMSPQGHYNHVHVAWNKGNVKPLIEEMRYKPTGSQLGVANSSETILNKDQTSMLANVLKGGKGDIVINGGIHVSGVSDSDEAANAIAAKILNAVRQAENSTIS